MRYNIGEELYAVNFQYMGNSMEENALYRQPYLHGLVPPVVGIRLIKLKVMQHHKVPDTFDEKEELKYDGYLLLDPDGKVYTNQYPRASYGQMSDHMDRRFRYKLPVTDEEREAYHNYVTTNGMPAQEFHLLSDLVSDLAHGVMLVDETIERLKTGRVDQTKYKSVTELEVYRSTLSDLMEKIHKAFRNAFPDVEYDVVNEPFFEDEPDGLKHWVVKFKTV